jgi:hypothetical protein
MLFACRLSSQFCGLVLACGSRVDRAAQVPGGACIGKALPGALAKSHVLAGASMADATASAAAWDLRYLYLAGGLFDGAAPCASCATSCTALGRSCANSAGGCAWWGCYQYDQNPPGEYVRNFVAAAKGRGQVPWFTYYELLQASQTTEGSAEVAAINGAAFLTRYLGDFRFLLQQISNEPAFIQVEPDFWGFAQRVNAFTWAKALAEALQLPVVYWQVPVGNAAQTNTADH